MAIKVLDYNGLKQLTSKFKDYVNKATSGKANTNDLNKLISNLKVQDTRNANENPSYYIKNKSKEVVKELKIQKAIGVNSDSDSCLLVTMFPWYDNTAGYPVQLVFLTKSDVIYTRRGTSDTSWGRWRKVLDDSDLKTKLSQLSQDSTHRLVTDAEKAKWNNKAEVSYVDSAKSSLSSDITNKYNSLNTNKANKSDLNSYVKKDGNKVLSDNNFSSSLMNKLSRVSNKSDAELVSTIREIAYADYIFSKTSGLAGELNSKFGTSLSSSISSVSSLVNSQSAIAAVANNKYAIRSALKANSFNQAMANSTTAVSAIISSEIGLEALINSENGMLAIASSESAMNKVVEKDAVYKKMLTSPIAMDAIAYNRGAMDLISKSTARLKTLSESEVALNALYAYKTTFVGQGVDRQPLILNGKFLVLKSTFGQFTGIVGKPMEDEYKNEYAKWPDTSWTYNKDYIYFNTKPACLHHLEVNGNAYCDVYVIKYDYEG